MGFDVSLEDASSFHEVRLFLHRPAFSSIHILARFASFHILAPGSHRLTGQGELSR